MIEVNPRVKDALRSGAYRKNYRINVLNDDGTTDFTLNNTELVSESVKIDERMCSGDTLKFGLCEGSSIEFQYFNHDNINHPNIRGRRIQVFVDVQYKDADGELDWESIPLGFFDIQECSTQFSTGIMKVVGYNKLKSAYLDNKANDQIVEIVEAGIPGMSGALDVGLILSDLLDGYTVFNDYTISSLTAWGDASTQKTMQYHQTTSTGEDLGYYLGYLTDAWWLFYIDNFSNDKKYRMRVNAKNIFDRIISYIPAEYLEEYYKETNYAYAQEPQKLISRLKDGGLNHVEYYIYITLRRNGGGGQTIRINENENYKENGIYSSWMTDLGQQTTAGSEWTPIVTTIPTMWKKIDHAGGVRDAFTNEEKAIARERSISIMTDPNCFAIEEVTEEGLAAVTFTVAQAEALPDVTIRELQSAVFETAAEFGQLSRTTDLFDGVTLSRERLFPADDLYPSDTLYPQGTSESTFKSMYEKLWTDSVGEQTFRKLYITYKGLDDQQREKEFVLERTVNADGTTDYYCDDNWLFKNLIWTAEQVGDYADAMVLKMRGIKWFPFEMWSGGLPYIEVGDELEINTKDGTYTSYVLQRQMKGIQNLQDTYINGTLDIF